VSTPANGFETRKVDMAVNPLVFTKNGGIRLINQANASP
jgi:hypothetical protein